MPSLIRQSTVSIINIPPEILLTIFKIIHDEIIDDRELLNRQQEEKDDSRAPSLFPHTFASVSKLWSDIMAMEPMFWTRIVIFIDSSEFSLSSISSHFSYSHRLPIDVKVTKRTPDLISVSEAHENRRLQAIADIVRPHIHRCRSLRYEVTYTSSLPRIST